MRKFVTVLMMVLMLSVSARYAAAGGDGGGIVNLNTVSAFSKPLTFATVAIIQIAVLLVLYKPHFKIPPTARHTTIELILTGTETLYFFQKFIQALNFYLVYQAIAQSLTPHAKPVTTGTSNVNSTGREAEDEKKPPMFNYLAVKKEPEAEKNQINLETEPEQAEADLLRQIEIENAVKTAMRSPEIAKKYLAYATPAMRDALNKALKNRAAAAHGSR